MLAVKFVKPGVGYHQAIDQWLAIQRPDVVYVFVQFLNVVLGEAPRVYVARPPEIAAHLKTQCGGRGHGSLQEDFRRNHPKSKYDHQIPQKWAFDFNRIQQI